MCQKVTSYKATEETSKCSFHTLYYNKPVLHDCNWKIQLRIRYDRPELQEFRDLQTSARTIDAITYLGMYTRVNKNPSA